MGDLTRTFGGLIIMAHRVNRQTLFKIPSIYTYIIRFLYFPIFSYIFLYIFSYIFLYKSTRARCSLLAARHCICLQRSDVGTELGHATRRRQSDHATCPSVCSMQASPTVV